MFKLPKNLRRTKFDQLFSIEMNDFDVERLLPTLFNLVVSRGRNRTAGSNEQKTIEEFVDGLAQNPHVKGFDTTEGRQLLEQWVRSVSVEVGQAGRGKHREKLEFVNPNTLLTYKTGLPKPSSRQRNVPRFLYTAMCDCGLGGTLNERRLNLQTWLKGVFGAGLLMQDTPPYEGRFDGESEVDIHTLLTLHLLNEFETGAIAQKELDEPKPCLPRQASQMGQNVLLLLRGYEGLLPSAFICKMLMSIINLDLLTYTLRLQASVASLCRSGQMPDETEIRQEIYLDVTGDRTSQSDAVARMCVERDLESLGRFFENNLRLFTLHRMRELSDSIQQLVPYDAERPTADYLTALLQAEDSDLIRVRAEMELEEILRESQGEVTSEAEREDLRRELRDLVLQRSAIGTLNVTLRDALRRKAVQSYTQWYKGVGGLNRSYGLLLGNERGPRNWRYTWTDELLRTLVYLNAVERFRDNINEAKPAPSIRLSEFVEWLGTRFGIVVDRPPVSMESSSSRAAAAANFVAFKRRLRQIGFFRGLSDDFNVQNLTVDLKQGVMEETVA